MLGGVESTLLTLAQYSSACPGFEQKIALTFEGKFADSLRREGMQVFPLPAVQLRNPISVLRARRELHRLLGRERFEVVISHSAWCQVVFGPVLTNSGKAVVFWMHGTFDGHWLQKLASRHRPDLAICNSEYTKSTLHLIYPRLTSKVIYLPVGPLKAISDREQLRSRLGADAHTVVILMASRMEHWKGHFNLLHAAKRISSKTNWMMWIAGGPQNSDEHDYFESLVADTRRLGLAEQVHFLGNRDDVPALMQACDIYCQPNAAPEPFGVVFVEALQAGVPVVTFSMGGPREILDDDSGILVQAGDIADLASTLTLLIENPAMRERFRTTGPIRAKALCDPGRQLQMIYEALHDMDKRKFR
jgi:glycosyltransferase involved in cell wall biosynthesis